MPTSATRSMADLWPDSTTWPGSLSLATSQTSPCAASAAIFAATSIVTPSNAAIAPTPTGTAFCMACPRSFNSRAASPIENVPAAANAEYSPRLCPATNLTLSLSLKPCSASSTRMTAILTAISAGWAFSVSVKISPGPDHMISESFCPRAASTSSNTARAAGNASANVLPIPTAWLPCPGKINARAMAIVLLSYRRPFTTAPSRAHHHGAGGLSSGSRVDAETVRNPETPSNRLKKNSHACHNSSSWPRRSV